LTTNKNVLSILDTLLNILPADRLAIELVDGHDGAGNDGGSSSIASFDGGASFVAMGVVVRLSNREGSCAEERNSGELHCEEANSCCMNRLKD
jgi:hypothetical protein